MPFFLWIAIFLALALLGVGLVVTLRGEKSLVDKRLESYMQQERSSEPAETEVKQAREAILTDWITKTVEQTNLETTLRGSWLEQILSLRPANILP